MKRYACLILAAFFSTAAPAAAQSIFFGVGPTFPSSDYADYAKTGFMIVGGVTYEIAPNLDVYGEGAWGQNNHDTDGDKTNPSSIMAGLLYGFGGEDAPVSPYVFGGGGMLTHRYSSDEFGSSSDTKFGFQAGAGLGFNLGGFDAFTEGRYTSASFDGSTTAFLGIVAGLSFNFGS
jgi:opacity protein-like surface antigen